MARESTLSIYAKGAMLSRSRLIDRGLGMDNRNANPRCTPNSLTLFSSSPEFKRVVKTVRGE
jgi:hypothetical protein